MDKSLFGFWWGPRALAYVALTVLLWYQHSDACACVPWPRATWGESLRPGLQSGLLTGGSTGCPMATEKWGLWPPNNTSHHTQHHSTGNSQRCYYFACLVTLTSIFYSWVVSVKSIKNAVQNPHRLNKASGAQSLYLKSKTSTEARAKRKSCIFMTINKDNYILIMKTGFFLDSVVAIIISQSYIHISCRTLNWI